MKYIFYAVSFLLFSCSNPKKEASAYMDKASEEIQKNNYQQAIVFFDLAFDKYNEAKYFDERYCSAFFMRASCYKNLDNEKEACLNYKQGKKLVGENPNYRSYYMVKMIEQADKIFLGYCNLPVVPPPPMPDPVEVDTPVPEKQTFTEDDFMGIWNVTMKVTESSCDGNAVGDSKSETWTIEKKEDEIQIRVSNNKNTVDFYKATYIPGKNAIIAKGTGMDFFTTGNATINITMTEENSMLGEREILLNTPCKIVYDLNATKQ